MPVGFVPFGREGDGLGWLGLVCCVGGVVSEGVGSGWGGLRRAGFGVSSAGFGGWHQERKTVSVAQEIAALIEGVRKEEMADLRLTMVGPSVR